MPVRHALEPRVAACQQSRPESRLNRTIALSKLPSRGQDVYRRRRISRPLAAAHDARTVDPDPRERYAPARTLGSPQRSERRVKLASFWCLLNERRLVLLLKCSRQRVSLYPVHTDS
jgi:hypothetical protein